MSLELEAEKEAKLKAMLVLNDELLEELIKEFESYIGVIRQELERRKNK